MLHSRNSCHMFYTASIIALAFTISIMHSILQGQIVPTHLTESTKSASGRKESRTKKRPRLVLLLSSLSAFFSLIGPAYQLRGETRRKVKGTGHAELHLCIGLLYCSYNFLWVNYFTRRSKPRRDSLFVLNETKSRPRGGSGRIRHGLGWPVTEAQMGGAGLTPLLCAICPHGSSTSRRAEGRPLNFSY